MFEDAFAVASTLPCAMREMIAEIAISYSPIGSQMSMANAVTGSL